MKRISKLVILIVIAVFIGMFYYVEVNEDKLISVKDIQVSRITLNHHNEIVEVSQENPDFEAIIELISQVKLRNKYVGPILLGEGIEVSFYEGDQLIVSITPGIAQTSVDGIIFNTSQESFQMTEQLDHILGKYYGYNQ
ncbi:MAG: hypothetical protein RR565_04990 [Erysipelothrix sp.]